MKKQHLYEVDFLRAFVILGVVCVHTLSYFLLFENPFTVSDIGIDGAIAAFHFTREAFMTMTGLVLFITYYHKSFNAREFWAKRFKLIVIPYIAWILIYILFEGTYVKNFHWTFSYVLSTFGHSLLTGDQFFMYYLVISMQLYIVFPWFVKWLRRSERWHLAIFVISFLLEIGLMALNQYVLQPMHLSGLPAWLSTLIRYRDRNIITYQFWFIIGALIAIHYPRFKAFLMKHIRWVFAAWCVSLAGLWAHFAYDRLLLHEDQATSVLVLQPIMVVYSLFVTLLLLYFGIRWANVREVSSWRAFSKFVETAAAASFGVFLVHPLILHYLALAVYKLHPNPVLRRCLIPLSIAIVYGLGIIVARLIACIPSVSYIVGQRTPAPRWWNGLGRAITSLADR